MGIILFVKLNTKFVCFSPGKQIMVFNQNEIGMKQNLQILFQFRCDERRCYFQIKQRLIIKLLDECLNNKDTDY